MIIMVTGSSGFVGSHLVKKLKELNHEVLELDKTLGHDLTDHKCLSTFNTADAVIHLAARVFVPESYSNPRTFYYDNFVTTLIAWSLPGRTRQSLSIRVLTYMENQATCR